MNKKIIILAIIALLIVSGGLWWFYYGKENLVPATQPIELVDDTTSSIDQALQEVELGEIDGELSDIDEAIKGL